MSVYTPVHLPDLELFTHSRSLGQPLHLHSIAQGIINSNFRLTTTQGQFILTLVENPEEAQSLPFTMTLLDKLVHAGLPVPSPIKDHHGQAIFSLSGRPALIVTLLPGISPDPPTPDQCRQLGTALGRIHIHGNTSSPPRPNPMGSEAWEKMIHQLSTTLDTIDQDIVAWLKGELAWLQDHWLTLPLPTGLCHADLFPDNTLFCDNQLTGIIDFYSSCHGPWLYDLAICLCSWCQDDLGKPHPERIHALLESYDRVRPRHHAEHEHLVAACRAAAFRFSLSRFYNHCFPKLGATVTRRNPESFMARLRFWQGNTPPGVFSTR
ncbi:MAG TPA: homoserine kinase [Magnetococcales bacterium]|nr:homoserine kinase [Magnetococcales bacterium]